MRHKRLPKKESLSGRFMRHQFERIRKLLSDGRAKQRWENRLPQGSLTFKAFSRSVMSHLKLLTIRTGYLSKSGLREVVAAIDELAGLGLRAGSEAFFVADFPGEEPRRILVVIRLKGYRRMRSSGHPEFTPRIRKAILKLHHLHKRLDADAARKTLDDVLITNVREIETVGPLALLHVYEAIQTGLRKFSVEDWRRARMILKQQDTKGENQ